MLRKRLQKEALDEVERQAGILGLSETTRKSLVRGAAEVINGTFHGAPFSSRIWANKNELVARLQVGLERSILQGEHPDRWARLFTDLVSAEMGEKAGRALFAARRLAITESARVMSEIQLNSFEAGGFNKYIWITEMDDRTCPVCSALDEEVFDIDRSEIGANLPPLHPFCRCSVAAYVEDEESDITSINVSDERLRGFDLSEEESKIIRNEGTAREQVLTVRDVANVSYPMQISTAVSKHVDEAISYYQGQMERLLEGIPEKLKQGDLPKVVIVDTKELGSGLAMYSRANNSIFVNAGTFDDERTLAELHRYERDMGTKFARSDDSLSTLAHEFGHRTIFEAAERMFGKEDILESVQLYSEDLMDDLLKEGYNVLKNSSKYGCDQMLRKEFEEPIAESLVRVFLGERSAIFEYMERRLINDD